MQQDGLDGLACDDTSGVWMDGQSGLSVTKVTIEQFGARIAAQQSMKLHSCSDPLGTVSY